MIRSKPRKSPVPRIVIANNKDSYSSKAEEDSFGFASDRATAAAEADILFLLFRVR